MSNKPLTVRFSNGKTRTLPENEALWLPDAMFERIKFEFNLPSTARKYLEEYNDDYPNNSLPGYPTTNSSNPNKKCEDVVMPRMVYDIWPYFVPFYPLYSNILYPAANTIQAESCSTSFKFPNGANAMTPTYYRQIRSNPASVNAETINKSVVGTLLTPDELDVKIRKQIHNNRHLIDPNPYEVNNCQPQASKTSVMCSCNSNKSQNSFRLNQIENSCESSSCNESHECDDNNKHYKNYLKLIQGLYDSCKQDNINSKNQPQKKCCSCSQNLTNSNTSFNRSKSVTFSDSHSSMHDYDGCSYDEEVLHDPYKRTQSSNTDVTFNKNKKEKSSNLTQSKFISRRHWNCFR